MTDIDRFPDSAYETIIEKDDWGSCVYHFEDPLVFQRLRWLELQALMNPKDRAFWHEQVREAEEIKWIYAVHNIVKTVRASNPGPVETMQPAARDVMVMYLYSLRRRIGEDAYQRGYLIPRVPPHRCVDVTTYYDKTSVFKRNP